MPELAIVTYLRGQERLTPELIDIGNQLHRRYPGLVMELYVESKEMVPAPGADFPIRVTHVQGTKYRKLLHALHGAAHRYLLSLDNDIAADIPSLLRLVAQTVDGDFDLGWGRIHSRRVSSFISRLVEVDKLLSHTVLRPALWRLHLGVTIPGQCFLLKAASFQGSLPGTDTFLDDLSIGLHAAKHRLRYHYAQEVVAFELPSYSFAALWKQRSRWATGFRQSLSCATLTRQDRRLLWIHAFCYHLLPILHVTALAVLAPQAPQACAGWLGILALAMARHRPQALGAALAYPVLFPLFHVGWWLHFFHVKS
ncbi:glycosyltransferase [Burkholderia gladioli]|uniref:glycosyltransferase n=1 Tax=Burkholderia gladioli TaxID=28095 RepID=UPI00163E02CC|nr:glycosyltransferase family 2 protein [Burkholderia gladioli]